MWTNPPEKLARISDGFTGYAVEHPQIDVSDVLRENGHIAELEPETGTLEEVTAGRTSLDEHMAPLRIQDSQNDSWKTRTRSDIQPPSTPVETQKSAPTDALLDQPRDLTGRVDPRYQILRAPESDHIRPEQNQSIPNVRLEARPNLTSERTAESGYYFAHTSIRSTKLSRDG